MKRTIPIVVIVLFAVFSLTNCNNGGGKADEEREVVKIGAVLPLTGSLSFYGENERNGLLTGSEVLDDSSCRIKIILEDSKASPKSGVSAAKKLVEREKVDVIITSLTGVSIAIKEYLKSKESDIIQFSLSMNEEVAKGRKNTYRLYPGIKEEGKNLISIIKKKNPDKVGILHFEQEAYKNQINNVILPELNSYDVYVESFRAIDINLRNTLTKLKDFDPDILYIGAYYNQMQSIIKIIKEIQFNETIVISGLNMAVALNQNLVSLKDFKSAYIAMPSKFSYKDLSSNGYIQKYNEKYNNVPNYDATYSYATLQIIKEVLCGESKDFSEFYTYLTKNDRAFETVAGEIKFDPDGNATTDWKIDTISELE